MDGFDVTDFAGQGGNLPDLWQGASSRASDKSCRPTGRQRERPLAPLLLSGSVYYFEGSSLVRFIRLFGRRLLDGREKPRPPKDRCDVDDPRPIPVDHAKWPNDDFPDFWICTLWHHPAGLGEGPEALDGGDDSINRELRIAARVLGDVLANCLDISDCLRGPPDLRHWLRWRLTSSCAMPLPASISLSPASILAKKIKRSIASSNVASDGRSCRASRI